MSNLFDLTRKGWLEKHLARIIGRILLAYFGLKQARKVEDAQRDANKKAFESQREQYFRGRKL